MSNLERGHPQWCDVDSCQSEVNAGPHQSRPVRLTAGAGAGKEPKILLVIWSPPGWKPVKIRMVVISDLLVNTLDLDLSAAAMLATRLEELVGRAE